MTSQRTEPASALGSATASPVTVTLPVFSTVMRYEIISPTVEYGADDDDLVTTIDGLATAGTITAFDGVLIGAPVAPVPVAVATLRTEPASRSACVTV